MAGYLERSIAAPRARFGTSEIRFVHQLAHKAAVSYTLLLLFFVVVYSNIGVLIPALGEIGPAQVVAGLAVFLLFIEKVLARQDVDLVWPESHLAIAFLWAAGLSCFMAAWPKYSVEALMDVAKFTVIYFLIVNVVNHERRVRGIMWTMVLAGLIPTVMSLRNYAHGIMHEDRVHWVGIFANSNDLAYSLVILVPLAAVLSFELRPRWRPFVWLIIAAYFATIFVTYSRGGMIGLFAVLAMFGLRQRTRFIRLATVGILVGGVIFLGYFWHRSQGFADLSSDATVNERLVTIKAGLAMFFDRPLLGVGIGGSVAAFPQYVPPELGFNKALVTHNTAVQALSETGIIGFTLFALFIGMALYDARQMTKNCALQGFPGLARLALALEVSLWGFVVCGISGGYVLSWFPFILVALISATKKLTVQNLQRSAQHGGMGQRGR